jgi:hypothetical protein
MASKRRSNVPASTQAARQRDIGRPVFSEPEPTADPTTFRVRHPSDGPGYKEIDELNAEYRIEPLPFPAPRGDVEPVQTLEQALGGNAAVRALTAQKQIVFHATGDCDTALLEAQEVRKRRESQARRKR